MTVLSVIFYVIIPIIILVGGLITCMWCCVMCDENGGKCTTPLEERQRIVTLVFIAVLFLYFLPLLIISQIQTKQFHASDEARNLASLRKKLKDKKREQEAPPTPPMCDETQAQRLKLFCNPFVSDETEITKCHETVDLWAQVRQAKEWINWVQPTCRMPYPFIEMIESLREIGSVANSKLLTSWKSCAAEVLHLEDEEWKRQKIVQVPIAPDMFNAGSAADTGLKVCFPLSVTSHNTDHLLLEDTLTFTVYLPALFRTASPSFHYGIYVGWDQGDILFDNQENMDFFRILFFEMLEKSSTVREASGMPPLNPERFELVLRNYTDSRNNNVAAVNHLAVECYENDYDYFFRVNDDSELHTPYWTEIMVEKLKVHDDFGVVGVYDARNPRIFTHSMVGRPHMKIFGSLFNPLFKNWWSDDWQTFVYDDAFTYRVYDVEVKHHVHPSRYDVDDSLKRLLVPSLRRGRSKWLGHLCYKMMPKKGASEDLKKWWQSTKYLQFVAPQLCKNPSPTFVFRRTEWGALMKLPKGETGETIRNDWVAGLAAALRKERKQRTSKQKVLDNIAEKLGRNQRRKPQQQRKAGQSINRAIRQ